MDDWGKKIAEAWTEGYKATARASLRRQIAELLASTGPDRQRRAEHIRFLIEHAIPPER